MNERREKITTTKRDLLKVVDGETNLNPQPVEINIEDLFSDIDREFAKKIMTNDMGDQ